MASSRRLEVTPLRTRGRAQGCQRGSHYRPIELVSAVQGHISRGRSSRTKVCSLEIDASASARVIALLVSRLQLAPPLRWGWTANQILFASESWWLTLLGTEACDRVAEEVASAATLRRAVTPWLCRGEAGSTPAVLFQFAVYADISRGHGQSGDAAWLSVKRGCLASPNRPSQFRNRFVLRRKSPVRPIHDYLGELSMVTIAPDSQGSVGMSLSHRLLRFGLVGTACFVLQYCLTHTLAHSMYIYFAAVLAFLFSAQFNFLLSQIFTWADRQSTVHLAMRWVKFNASALISVVIVNGTVFGLLASVGVWWWASMLIANAMSTAFTFIINHFVVFKTELQAASPPALPDQPSLHVSSAAFFLPAHNEAKNLPNVIKLVHEYFNKAAITERSVIVVDDGSTDDTAEVIAGIQAACPVTLVTHEVNRGYGAALRSGFEAALATGYEWIAFCDSDGQFNPEDLALLFEAARREDVKVVLGYRARRADNWRRQIAGRMWHSVSQAVLEFRATDVDCGFKLFRREVLLTVTPKLRGNYATISPELLARVHQAGHRFAEVAVPHYPRSEGKQSGMNVRVMVGSFTGLYPIRREIFARASV
jgi:putative flippase GtrA